MLARTLARSLVSAGHGVALAADAEEVERARRKRPPDLAVVDMRLRDGLTGPQIARRLVEEGTPVIICSGESGARQQLSTVAVAAYLEKPVVPSQVLAVIQELEPEGDWTRP